MARTSKFFIGTSGWSYPHWFGRFYPEDWPKSKWFEFYVQKFPAVEVNATFYRTFKEQTYRNWQAKAPAGFLYVLKAPGLITHRKYLQEVENECRNFWNSAALLEDRLGLILLQLAPNTPYEPERLRRALLAFADPKKIAVEFRHPRWFTEETKSLLKELGAVFCTADSPKTQLMNWVTSDSAYIRLHGRQRWFAYDYSESELREIAELAKTMAAAGAKRVFIFFNNDVDGSAPRNALSLSGLLNL